VNHRKEEYARGDVHNNTDESFSAIVEKAKQGGFHFWRQGHFKRFQHEIEFRLKHREPALK